MASVLVSIWLILATASSAATEAVTYAKLVAALYSAPTSVKAEFAEVALAQLDASYVAVNRRYVAAGTADRRWQASVDDYRARLRTLAAGIGPDTAVALRTGPDRRTQILIGDTVVIVSSPRASQQAQLEQRITDRFCANYLCHPLLSANAAAERAASGVTFGFDIQHDAGLSCNSGDGLEFLFFARDQVAERRHWCRRIVAELRTLAWALRQRLAAGVVITWQDFAILPASFHASLPASGLADGVGADRDRGARTVTGRNPVRLNDAGDTLLLDLPLCAAAPQLIARLLPWLATRAEGLGQQGIELVITNTEALIDPLVPSSVP